MRLPLPAAALVALLLLSAAYGIGAPAASPMTRVVAWDVTAVPCASASDGVCLAFDGQIPGPTLDVTFGDEVVLTITNRIAATLPPGAPAHLATTDVSFHVHGTALAADMDGVRAHAGTQLVESVAAPGGSFTYRFRAAFVGAWHYHDHVIGPDGAEGASRGLFGALIVRNGGEPRPDAVLDIHAHDAAGGAFTASPVAVNAGFGVRGQYAAGDDVEVIVVGLGNYVWRVDVAGRAMTTAPGLSERFLLQDVTAPIQWRAQWGPFAYAGEVAPS